MTKSWPPIIEFGRMPRWLRVRDILLTAAAWVRLVYPMRDGVRLVIDYFSYPIFELTHPHSLRWLDLSNRLSNFLILSAVPMVWLVLWGLIHRRRLQLAAHVIPPPQLSLEQHAAAFQLDPAAVERSHEAKIAVVQFGADRRIASLSLQPPNRGAS